MKSRILKSIFFITVAIFSFISCVNNEEYTLPESGIITYNLITNKTVQDIVTASTGSATLYNTDDIIEAYVTSSDESGNFFGTITFQTIPIDGSAPIGFSVSVDLKSYKEGFIPGRKVYIKLKGLYTAFQDGSLKIGSQYQVTDIGRIASYDWNKYLFPSPIITPENSFARILTLAQAATSANLNTLIDLDNIQFADGSLTRSFYDIDNGGLATNHNVVDILGGTTRFFRVSKFALFAAQFVPSGRGKIRGIMTKYGSDYQFIARTENDIKLTTPRTYTFSGTLSENFQSFAVNQKAFPNYLNLTVEGAKDWTVKNGNFIEMSAFGGNVEKSKTFFMIPIDMTTANTLKFDIKVGFFTNALGLKVYRTTNYVPGMKISDATLIDITTSFALPSASTSAFVSAGTYNIPVNVTGNGYFLFEYSGTNISTGPPITTTIDIDNIVVN